MSVLIKGMQLPDMCGHCRFATAFECEVTKNFITTFNVRQSDCPLIPIPPHGRLIDADVLADSFEPSDFWNPDAEENCFAAVSIVHSASTIIPSSEEG